MQRVFRQGSKEEFFSIRSFYWKLIDDMREESERIGWKKGIYPADDYLRESLKRGELFTLWEGDKLCACVILNSSSNEGYKGASWSQNCPDRDVLVPHALAVAQEMQGHGVGRALMEEIFTLARKRGKRAVRLDILDGNTAAEKLYTHCGFQYVQTRRMFYEDTGWTDYKLYERNL